MIKGLILASPRNVFVLACCCWMAIAASITSSALETLEKSNPDLFTRPLINSFFAKRKASSIQRDESVGEVIAASSSDLDQVEFVKLTGEEAAAAMASG